MTNIKEKKIHFVKKYRSWFGYNPYKEDPYNWFPVCGVSRHGAKTTQVWKKVTCKRCLVKSPDRYRDEIV